MAEPPVAMHTSMAEFVDPKVKTIPSTDAILKAILPFFPKTARVISGWLSMDDLYWKINFHWDYLLETIEHCETLALDEQPLRRLVTIRKSLLGSAPNPARGYRQSPIGLPKDQSSHESILERHGVVRRAKADFAALLKTSTIHELSPRDRKRIALAYAPVARPAQGKHSTGYALDIKGDNLEIKRIARSLGASLVFDEVSHVHCEWKNGVDTTAAGGSDRAAAAERAARQAIDSQVGPLRHCLLRMA